MNRLIKKYKYENGNFYNRLGRYTDIPVPEVSIFQDLLGLGVDPMEIKDKLNQLKSDCQVRELDGTEESLNEKLERLCIEHNVFENIVFMKIGSNIRQVYIKRGKSLIYGCPLSSFDSKEFKKFIIDYDLEARDIISKNFKNLFNSKKEDSNTVDIDLVLAKIFNLANINKLVDTVDLLEDIHPVTVETCDVPSLHKIPYTEKSVTIDDLNYYLKFFLETITNHEYFCAVLWAYLTGNYLPYVLYLNSGGGHGKSQFITMLSNLIGSAASFTEDSRFSTYHMYNKGLVVISENKERTLMQHRLILQITGSDSVKIEGKGKDAFEGHIKGLVIVISNRPPIIQGESFENRRLRYHEIVSKQLDNNKILNRSDYQKEISSTPNEFLNYCRQCFENNSTEGKMIKEYPGFAETLDGLQDQIQIAKFNKFLKSEAMAGYEVNKDLSCDVGELLLLVQEKYPRDSYVASNFTRYLKTKHNVTEKSSKFVGIGKKYSKALDLQSNSDVGTKL